MASALSSFSRTRKAGDDVWETANDAKNEIAQSCITAIQNLFEVIFLLDVIPPQRGWWSISQTYRDRLKESLKRAPAQCTLLDLFPSGNCGQAIGWTLHKRG
jgi:hypothetical protein